MYTRLLPVYISDNDQSNPHQFTLEYSKVILGHLVADSTLADWDSNGNYCIKLIRKMGSLEQKHQVNFLTRQILNAFDLYKQDFSDVRSVINNIMFVAWYVATISGKTANSC